MNNNQKPIPQLQTITATKLMQTNYPPLKFSIEKILPQGIFILAGSAKIGKSWLSLDICNAVANGTDFWSYSVSLGEVLYLALEDTHPRLKSRLQRIEEENETENLHFAISAKGITNGLIEQIKAFIEAYPNTKLIVIDTLERVRNSAQDKSMYSCDYRDINKLREVVEGNTITLILVHHTRKMYDPDPLNTLSGSTGLVGAVDGVWVLEKENRTEGKGKLTIANRDTEGFCFNVEFEKEHCKWKFLGINDGREKDETDDQFCQLINDFLGVQFMGTASELVNRLSKIDHSVNITPRSITRS
ncbi:MAG: AAA family ATPase [Clostridia bacterium]